MINHEIELPEKIAGLLQPSTDTEVDDRFLALAGANAHDQLHGTEFGAEVVKRLMYRGGVEFDADDSGDATPPLWTIEKSYSAHRTLQLGQAVGHIIGVRIGLYERVDNGSGPKVLVGPVNEPELMMHTGKQLVENPILERAARYPIDTQFPIIVGRFYSNRNSSLNLSRAMRGMLQTVYG